MPTYEVTTPVGKHRLKIQQETIEQDDITITHYRGVVVGEFLAATGRSELEVYERLLAAMRDRLTP